MRLEAECFPLFAGGVALVMAAELLCAHLSRMTHYSNREVLQRIDEYTSQFGDF